jgi:hypothetical protein
MKSAVLTIAFATITAAVSSFAPSPTFADWDPAQEARDAAARKKAQAEAAKRAAETSELKAAHYRKLLAAAPYNEPAAKLAPMKESALKALYDSRSKQMVSAQKAQSMQRLDDMEKIMERLSPEQRATIEKQSGVSLEQVRKDMKAVK